MGYAWVNCKSDFPPRDYGRAFDFLLFIVQIPAAEEKQRGKYSAPGQATNGECRNLGTNFEVRKLVTLP